ncbi:MAG: type I methionyl aminopeptidase [Candidatus Magasanikbacteria bacterium]|jgi:methionyl aminopeptidase|nr:type I methionyl aminopeptidase [Candidatus Magasanikbacteria bacterium]MBT4220807.1 type I methionyl aminopeptidase [Candidatus Magasanikbacteria bacterium]MBT4350152.1 type I methionyl aminopeptidase [Candidatus Magasanikbacteria bacterium]MBT4541405.1 type I methionyl aminopeptidase [Candidatus Magasanikbacteria bacterium]MBT6253155.1 type I methionyl aminopeptidase [Candidatus Magasanikbacteria bacterium]
MYIKSESDIAKLIEGGKHLGEILEVLSLMVAPGVSAWEIDQVAEKRIRAIGGRPAFKGYKSGKGGTPFPSTVCFSRNEEVVHGIASKNKIIQKGDIITIDIGMEYPAKNGCFTDTAITVLVEPVDKKVSAMLDVANASLEKGISLMRPGYTVADIGKIIEDTITPHGYGIVRDLSGHGVGHGVHEDPWVPNYYEKSLKKWVLEPGVVLAIEPMITLGTHAITTADDGWGIITTDKSLSVHTEHTVIVTKGDPLIVTRRPSELS